jgi:uroporphyrinogen-III decarboxylase
MIEEFERILPVLKSGGYMLGIDHQTPPEVSLENYYIFLDLFKEYSVKAVL